MKPGTLRRLAVRLTIRFGRILLLLVVAVAVVRHFSPRVRLGTDVALATVLGNRITDKARIFPFRDRLMMNMYLDAIERETGIDIYLLFAQPTGNLTLEEFTAKEASRRKLGRRSGLRGILIVFDPGTERLRVELGYGLEEYFSDAFIGFLIDEHAETFFRSGAADLGLRLLIRILHERIRDQIMGGTFDPTPFASRRGSAFVSGGAGASGAAPRGTEGLEAFRAVRDRSPGDDALGERRPGPQPTVAAAYDRYIEWLGGSSPDPNVGLFTPESQAFLDRLGISRGYFDHILFTVWNRRYEIVERGDMAMLYYTDTPLRCPTFFRLGAGGWQVDIMEEYDNTTEFIDQPYTWSMNNIGESASRFADQFVVIDGFIRVSAGDNRALPTASR